MKLIAVIPAYNEGSQLSKVIQTVKPHVDEVIVVDDGSKDNTYNIAYNENIIVAKHIVNRGQGAALQTGMDLALVHGADIIIHFDADGQHPAHQIQELIQPIIDGHVLVTLGSRFKGNVENMKQSRKLLLQIALFFFKKIHGIDISDLHNGFRAIHKDAAPLLRIHQDRMAHASELLQLISRNEIPFVEVPVTITYTDYSMAKGQSNLNSLRILKDLVKAALL